MRLDKFISNHSAASRSHVRRLLKQQAISVNGQPVTDPATQIAPNDQVLVEGIPVHPIGQLYYMLNKPSGYVCANRDSHLPTVFDLLGQDADLPEKHQLQIAGRLDADTTGLVLLTNDGAWNHRVTSPQSGCGKVYAVQLAEPFDTATEALFAKGILLRGEPKPTRPAQIQPVDDYQVLLTIHEGKYHQVKRMFAATGNHVVALHRQSIGEITLDPSLAPGQYRPLTDAEVTAADTRNSP